MSIREREVERERMCVCENFVTTNDRCSSVYESDLLSFCYFRKGTSQLKLDVTLT